GHVEAPGLEGLDVGGQLAESHGVGGPLLALEVARGLQLAARLAPQGPHALEVEAAIGRALAHGAAPAALEVVGRRAGVPGGPGGVEALPQAPARGIDVVHREAVEGKLVV